MQQPTGGGGGGGRAGTEGPTAQEIVDYARYIGMDPIADVNLLWIAEEALCASLPEGWTEHTDQNGNTFYYNSTTGQSSWEHPLDEYYRSLFLKLKKILIDNRAAVKVNDSAVQVQCAIRACYARRIFRRLPRRSVSRADRCSGSSSASCPVRTFPAGSCPAAVPPP